jgi:hypothetical protein
MHTTQPRQCQVKEVAVVDASPAAMFGEMHGLPLSMTYTMGFLDNVDKSRRWFLLRAFFTETTRSCRPMEGPWDGDYTLAPEAADAYSGPVISGQRGQEWGYWRPDGEPLLTVDDRSCRLKEGEFIDLEGELVGPGCQLSAEHADHPMVYTSRPYLVRGRMRGEEVEGAFFVDSAHMPAGKSFYPSPYINDLQIAWVVYLNELTDGTWESGSFVAGFDGFECAFAQHDGALVGGSGEVTASFQIDGDDLGFPARAELSGADETFVWEADAGGRWPILEHLPEGHRLRRGTLRRAGSPAPVRRSYACLEGYPPRMSQLG